MVSDTYISKTDLGPTMIVPDMPDIDYFSMHPDLPIPSYKEVEFKLLRYEPEHQWINDEEYDKFIERIQGEIAQYHIDVPSKLWMLDYAKTHYPELLSKIVEIKPAWIYIRK